MPIPLLVAVAFAGAIHSALPAADGPAHQYVVGFSRPARGATAIVRAEARLAAHGFHRVRAFEEGLPGASDLARTSPRDRHGLDPAAVWLVADDDSAGAEDAIARLARDPEVAWIEPNRVRLPALTMIAPLPRTGGGDGPADGGVRVHAFPNDPLFADTRQWGLWNAGASGAYGGLAGADVGARAAWARGVGSNDLVLAIADTGIDPTHPEIAGTLPDGRPRVARGLDATGEAQPTVADSFGHGALVVGVMAARTNDGMHFDSLGVAGTCGGDGGANLGCRIVPIRITPGHSGNATSFDIARAIAFATASGARAMNLSFAGGGASRIERLALLDAITHGCVVVAAAGNRGVSAPTAPMYPAAYAAEGLCIQVGASDPFDRRAAFSSYGPGLDLVAPGTDVWTTYMAWPSAFGAAYDGYVAASGTSFAAPFVTGTVGLLCAARPALTDVDLQHVLRVTAHDVGAAGVDAETGWGRLDAGAAMMLVDGTHALWHDEVVPDRIRVTAIDTLTVGESGPGTFDRYLGRHVAACVEVAAEVTLPDSIADFGAAPDPVRAWTRIGATTTVRPGFALAGFVPWADVALLGPRSFEVHGCLYHVLGDSLADDAWVPLPPDAVRIGFTVLGPRRTERASAPTPSPRLAFTLGPNPFRDHVRATGPAGATIEVVDLAGRVVRREQMDARGAWAWDGSDRNGRAVPSGIYRVRCIDLRETRERRIVLLR